MSAPAWSNDDGQTPLAPEELGHLKPSIATRGQLNELERHNINTARIWAMKPAVLGRQDLLSDRFSRELHRRMFHRVWTWAGRYRTTERNLGWESHRITEGVRILFDDARYWVEAGTYPLPEAAVRLHHRLVRIHPWANGNGRHARLMADLLTASRGMPVLPWGQARAGSMPMGDVRQRYIAALREADRENFKPLLEFCCR